MSSSSSTKSGGIVTFKIEVKGSAIPDTTQVISIHIDKTINQFPRACISILDGDASSQTFKESSSDIFVPGNEISIQTGYDTKNSLIFKGIITGQNLRISGNSGSILEVECYDKAVKMGVGRKCKTFSKKKDSDIISSIIGTYSGISSDVTSTVIEWPEQLQYYATDWDYILTRAQANGLVVIANDGKVTVQKPNANKVSVLTVTYGVNLMKFNGDLNAINQLKEVTSSAWDYTNQKVIDSSDTIEAAGPGNLSSKKLADVIGLTSFEQQTSGALSESSLKTWSEAQITKSQLSKILGEAMFQGTSEVLPGSYITMNGLGDRFNGDYLVSGVIHDISDGGWTTEVQLGLSNQWISKQTEKAALGASGLIPGASGLINGVVKKMHQDPDSQFRILIDVPIIDSSGEGIWARLANFYASSGAGAFFLPEVGDEVVVGFLNEDPRYPVILGSMYSNDKNKPANGLDASETNPLKAIVTKSGISVTFDDENKVLSLETPEGNKVVLSDKDKAIQVLDQNDNVFEITQNGIVMNSPKDIIIDASQKLVLKGQMGVSLESSADLELNGMNIKANANVEFNAKGGAQAEVSGGAQLALKGAMVMIN